MPIYTNTDPNTVLLIHSDTTNNSTTMTDSSFQGRTITRSGSMMKHDSALAKFGATSLAFNGTDDYLTVASHADFDWGTDGDFTIDLWASSNTVASNRNWVSRKNTNTNNSFWFFRIENATKVTFANAPVEAQNQYDYIVSADESFTHYAVVRHNQVTTVYVNGQAVGNFNDSNNYTTNAGDIYIGSRVWGNSVTQFHHGYMDEIRISNVARWTSNFPVPASPYTTKTVDIASSLNPATNDLYDLGSSNKRWGHIYTTDLHLANERGDWTVIEEEDFLTLSNNKTGKRYKILMEEIR